MKIFKLNDYILPIYTQVSNKQECLIIPPPPPPPPPLCVEMRFTWTFPRNQDAKVKLKSELISIKF